MLAAFSFAKLLSWGKSLFTNQYFIIAAIVAAVAGGGYLYVHEHTKNAVTAAVAANNTAATVQTMQTKDATVTAAAKVDQKYDTLATKTAKDYDNVRITPPTDNSATSPADPLIVDTLNQLAGLHSAQPANGVSNSPD